MRFIRRLLERWGYVRIRDYGLVVTGAGQLVRVADGAVVSVGVAPPLARAPALPPPSEPTPVPHPAVGSNPPESAVPAPAFAPPRPERPASARPPPMPRPPKPPRAGTFPRRARPLPPPPPPTPDLGAPDTLEDERTELTQVDTRPRSLDLGETLDEPTVIDSDPAGAREDEPLPRLSRRLAGRSKT